MVGVSKSLVFLRNLIVLDSDKLRPLSSNSMMVMFLFLSVA